MKMDKTYACVPSLKVAFVGLGKLFKTPIFERWGKQFCLN